jgi:hypothetical protein
MHRACISTASWPPLAALLTSPPSPTRQHLPSASSRPFSKPAGRFLSPFLTARLSFLYPLVPYRLPLPPRFRILSRSLPISPSLPPSLPTTLHPPTFSLSHFLAADGMGEPALRISGGTGGNQVTVCAAHTEAHGARCADAPHEATQWGDAPQRHNGGRAARRDTVGGTRRSDAVWRDAVRHRPMRRT